MPNHSIGPGKDLRDRKDEEYPEWVRAAAFAITGEEAGSEKLFPTHFGDKTRLGIIRNINACFVGKVIESQLKYKYKSELLGLIFNRPTTAAAGNIDLAILTKKVTESEDIIHWWEPEEEKE